MSTWSIRKRLSRAGRGSGFFAGNSQDAPIGKEEKYSVDYSRFDRIQDEDEAPQPQRDWYSVFPRRSAEVGDDVVLCVEMMSCYGYFCSGIATTVVR